MIFGTVLVASDLSKASDRLIARLEGLQRMGARKAILFHALGVSRFSDMKAELTRLAEPRLREQEEALQRLGFETEVVIATGSPASEIHRAALKRRPSLLVLGSQEHTLTGELSLGSVTLDTLQRARHPVLVLRLALVEPRHEATWSAFGRHVLHPTDFSDPAERAFWLVKRMVEGGLRSVTLLHVQNSARIARGPRLDELDEIDRARLDRLKADLERAGADFVRTEVAYGSPSDEIVRCAGETIGTTIVMATRGRGVLKRALLGSVSQQVTRNAEAPIVLVPARRDMAEVG
ncbi:MAG TPA: universal stress protein [Anaeromyxobacter sp.]